MRKKSISHFSKLNMCALLLDLPTTSQCFHLRHHSNQLNLFFLSTYHQIKQMRGSVPLFWSQAWDSSGAALRPSIRMLNHLDPFYDATAKHFQDLQQRYGGPGTFYFKYKVLHAIL